MHYLKTAWACAWAMKWSSLAFVVSAALGLLSMGALGLGLYYPAAPALLGRYPPVGRWTGDWVWPATIAVGMLWSLAFLAAGALNLYLRRMAASKALRVAAYLLVLWLWSVVLWTVALQGQSWPAAH